MAMNEIDIILKKNPSINKEDLLILASWLLEYCDNKCPKSIASFRENIDKWCEVTIPLPHYFFIKHRDISKSDEFFNLLHGGSKFRGRNNLFSGGDSSKTSFLREKMSPWGQ